eukprot:g2689.t1
MLDGCAKAHEKPDPAEAQRLYARAMQLSPNNAKVNTNLGKWLFEQRRYDEAEPRLRAALEFEHRLGRAKSAMNLGGLLIVRRRYEEAEQVLQAQREVTPKDARLLGVLGALHISVAAETQDGKARAARLADAVATLRAALQAWPAFPDARSNLGMALERQGKPREALEQFREHRRRELKRTRRPDASVAKSIARLEKQLA